ncbi:hypothetical protein Nepgr_017519 [Nepenthes gracilis]|uniref:Uncharacterized protein n=1 Tax=Nepenthes gracilis TaxID=150966 RepID=A0AAD3SPI6_NEPGR|nr:hypothetical protein Nepgr_017519 [Nepenthes gracilis]
MAVNSCARVLPAFDGGRSRKSLEIRGLRSQLSTKAWRNCSNIGVAQIMAASWSDGRVFGASNGALAAATSVGAVSMTATGSVEQLPSIDDVAEVVDDVNTNWGVKLSSNDLRPSFFNSDGSIAIHAGERVGRGIVTDAITTPVVNTFAYFFKKTAELIDFEEGHHASFEYGRYGNPTTVVAEEKISALEGAESTLLMAFGMCASTVMLLALVPAGGHIVTTTDCYTKTRIFIETVLPKMGIKVTIIGPADIEALKAALDENNVNFFFKESPTNPFLRCVDIKLVSKLWHQKGALVLAGCVSGRKELISAVRNMHHVLGGALNPLNHSPPSSSSVDLQKATVVSECSANPFAPSVLIVMLNWWRAWIFSALKLQNSCLVVDPEHPTAEPSDQIRFEADESLSSTPSHNIYSGHTPDPKATGSLNSYVEALRSGIPVDGTGSLGMGAAPMSLCPILEADRLEALGISNCSEVEVVLTNCSSVHNALSFPKGWAQSQCTNSEQLCGSLDVLSCDANSGALVESDAVPPRVSGRDTLGEGFKLKSILKKPK